MDPQPENLLISFTVCFMTGAFVAFLIWISIPQ